MECWCAAVPTKEISTISKRGRLSSDIADRVRFLGFVKQSELIALYRHGNRPYLCELLWSRQSASLGGICSRLSCDSECDTGCREQLGSAALQVNPDNASEIARAVLRLKNQARPAEKLTTAGKVRASAFTADDYAARIIDLLDSLELRFSCFRRFP